MQPSESVLSGTSNASDASDSVVLREVRELRVLVEQSARSQAQALRSLEQKVLTIDDVDRILNVASMRRSMVLPWSHMLKLMDDPVDLAALVGKSAE